METLNPKPLEDRKWIARTVRELRLARGMTQSHLARLLLLSQSRLSEIESGQGSFSAEQFIRILRTFNVPVSRFDRGPRDVADSLQKALARLGAAHLVEDPDVLPSEQLENVESVIRETLVEGGAARALTALAPVLVNHLHRVNLSKLFSQFKDYGLERRFVWLIENITRAVHESLGEPWPRSYTIRLKQTETELEGFREWLLDAVAVRDSNPHEDTLGLPVVSSKTRDEIREEASDLSKRWSILTPIQVEDFVRALRDSQV